MLELAYRFVELPWGFLTLHGEYGNAKTSVLWASINEFRERHGIVGLCADARLTGVRVSRVRPCFDHDIG